mmetsp:Transcript_922/g.2345  ORF Transcript_922/g.2345 Transcript_922/m.2345 type:complete len:277 (-) Transcript_922:233-1063(-)
MSLGPRGHESICHDGTDDRDGDTEKPGHLEVFLVTGTTPHSHDTKATAAAFGLGHASEGKLGDADHPRETVGVLDEGRKGQSHERHDTPDLDLRLDVGLVGLDNQSLGPRRGIPFLGFLFVFQLGDGLLSFKGGLIALGHGVVADNVRDQTGKALVQSGLQNLVLHDLDLDLAFSVGCIIDQPLGDLDNFFVGGILSDSQFSVHFGALELELAFLRLLGLFNVPGKGFERIGDSGQGGKLCGLEWHGRDSMLRLSLLLLCRRSKGRDGCGKEQCRC